MNDDNDISAPLWLLALGVLMVAALFFCLGAATCSVIWRKDLTEKKLGRWTVDENTGDTRFEVEAHP